MNVFRMIAWAGLVAVMAIPSSVGAQGGQNLITVPGIGVTDSFYENIGVGWGFDGRRADGSGFFFNNGGAGGAIPPFGGFDPGSGASFGIGGPRGGINFTASQGSSRSIVADSASVMVPNGYGGAIFSGSQRPFVTGIVPVVGAGGAAPAPPRLISPLALKLQQLAAQGGLAPTSDRDEREEAPLRLGNSAPAPPAATSAAEAPEGSLSQLRRQRAAAAADQREQARQHIVTARGAESEGRYALARSEYRLALDLVEQDDPWRPKILERLRAIGRQSSAR